MQRVISSAESYSGPDVPVAALISIDDKIIYEAINSVEKSQNALYHAEFICIQKSLEILKTKYLDEASIYVTLEPCAFCAAALSRTRIKEIFFGAYDPKCGGVFHNSAIFEYSNHKPEIIGGIEETRCSAILKTFFSKLR